VHGDGERLGIQLDDGIERGAGFVNFGDAREVPIGEIARGEPAGARAFLEAGDGHFVEFKRGNRGSRIGRVCASRMRQCRESQRRSADFQAG